MSEKLEAIQHRFNSSKRTTQPRREVKKQDLRLYNNQSKGAEKISNSLLYSTVNTLLAMSYTDEMQAEFMGRELGDDERADNLTDIAKFDFDEMDLAYDKFLKQKDRLMMGLSIEVFVGWNEKTKTPVSKVIDPLSWYPDPNGHTHVKNFAYMGFEIETTIAKLKAIGGYTNLSKINTGLSTELTMVRDAEDVANNFNSQDKKFVHDENAAITIYVEYEFTADG